MGWRTNRRRRRNDSPRDTPKPGRAYRTGRGIPEARSIQSTDFEITSIVNSDTGNQSDFPPGTRAVMIALTVPAVTKFTGCGS